MIRSCLVLGFLLTAMSAAWARDFRAGAIRVVDPWARATPPGAQAGAAYMTLENDGDAPDRLLAAATPAAEGAAAHLMSMSDGMMGMAAAGPVEVPAHGRTVLAPGGLHLMLTGLKAPLARGGEVPMTLTFEKAGPVEVELTVARPGASGPDDH